MARRLKAHDPTKATRPKAEPVLVRNIAHPKVWATAMKVADGNAELIRVETYSRVVVTLEN